MRTRSGAQNKPPARLSRERLDAARRAIEQAKVLRLITNRPGISFRDLLRASSLTKKQLDPALETLLCEGTVRQEKDGCLYVSALSVPVSKAATDTVSSISCG